jgi:PiT family inorganic phosphate transporter
MSLSLLALDAAPTHAGPNYPVVITIIGVALIFDFINGFHDSANSIATIVSTRVLSPKYAVIWAAFFNFLAAFVLGLEVAGTIAAKIVDPAAATNQVVFAALVGAIIWDLVTWYWGIPSSSSHALIGAFVGAGIAASGFSVVKWTYLQMPLLGIVLAPTFCLMLGFLLMMLILWLCRKVHPAPLNRAFKKLQLVSASIYSLSHGGNDAQKTMGIIAALLVGEGLLVPGDPKVGLTGHDIPNWVVIGAYTAISLGTLTGGWRIVKTMGSKITKLRPVDGFAAETAGGVLIIGFTELGMPVSTTHSIAGAIMGVGATRRLSAVRWGISARIVWAWILTIPASAALAVVSYWITSLCLGVFKHLC